MEIPAAGNNRGVGVIGAGVIGAGVAQCLAQAGYGVVLVDISEGQLTEAIATIRRGLRMNQLFRSTSGVVVDGDPLARIRPTVDYDALQTCSFIIENVTEQWEAKSNVYAKLRDLAPLECVLAANTSAIPITRIGRAFGRPERTLGLHFMNPVPMKPVVELIRGEQTSDDTVGLANQLLASMGKRSVAVKDSPGFVSNRVLMLTVNEAAFLVHEGVASAEQVDDLFRSCFGHKMGPLETADLIGLDTVLQTLRVLSDSFRNEKFVPCPLLVQLVDAGLCGRKSGRGFRQYRQRKDE